MFWRHDNVQVNEPRFKVLSNLGFISQFGQIYLSASGSPSENCNNQMCQKEINTNCQWNNTWPSVSCSGEFPVPWEEPSILTLYKKVKWFQNRKLVGANYHFFLKFSVFFSFFPFLFPAPLSFSLSLFSSFFIQNPSIFRWTTVAEKILKCSKTFDIHFCLLVIYTYAKYSYIHKCIKVFT